MNKKIIIAILILILLAVGAWFFLRNTEENVPAKPLSEKAVGVHYVGGGVHTVEGTVTLPNPCYTLTVATERRSGSPEHVLLRFTAQSTADVCAQVLHEAPFRTTFNAADNAELSAEINGVPFLLELSRRDRISAEEGAEFLLSVGEGRWVEDMRVEFRGADDDSRCAVDVTCIQAGWATLRFSVNGEELKLRLPGDATVPNAVVVGSYIITLVEVKPEPRSTEPQESRAYQATIRVDIHDTKG